MAKFRNRVKGGSKGKRWPKGQSSSSNPTTCKYRNAAQTRFFEPVTGPSMLTKEAVDKHTAKLNLKSGTSSDDDAESFGGKTLKTFDTFASDWSSCSNQSFNKLINNFKADSAMQKDMLAVLAAVTEVIKENGGNETSTEYFGALMTALDAEGNTDETLAAILNLISMGIKSVPIPVLQAKFSESSTRIISVLKRFAESEKTAVIRALLGILSVLLRAQDPGVWGDPSTIQVLDVLLSFVNFSKPKIRKAAQHGVTVLVRSSQIPASGLGHIARHCIKLIESAALGSLTATLHTFTLLKDIIQTFPKKELKLCCETVLKVMTLNNVLITSCGLQVLHGLFTGQPQAALSAADTARLLNALYDYQPPATDLQPTHAWLATLSQGYLFLAGKDLSLCVSNLPKVFKTCLKLLQTERAETLSAVTHSLSGLLSGCLRPATRTDQQLARYSTDLAAIADQLKACFSYEYHPAWAHVLHLIAELFQSIGDTCWAMLQPTLRLLVELRDSEQFTFINELENAIGLAVKAMGPQHLLKLVPLQIDPNDPKGEFKRSWLLPVLKDNVKGSTLKIFIDHFLPLATTCKRTSEELKAKNENIRAVGYDLLQTQIWSLLPSFANEPKDIALSFPVIAKALGGVLQSRKDLRNIVFTTLRRLCAHALRSEAPEDLATMSKYAKNYLPIFFSLYTTKVKGTDEEGARLAAFETVKVYLKIAPPETRQLLFDKALDKIKSADVDEFVKESVLDLCRALLPYQGRESLESFYENILTKIKESDDQREQKKYYRLLEEICSGESEALDTFLVDKLDEIQNLLTETLSKSPAISKKPRLRCILYLLKRLQEPTSFMRLILPEVILSVRDVNSKARQTAFAIIAHIAQTSQPDDYLDILMAGLSGTAHMMSASLLAASVVIYHAREKITDEVEQNLLYCVGLLLVCSTREIVISALSFIKVYMQAYPRDKIGHFLPELMKLLSKMTEDCKRHARRKTRDILSRLVRWFGADEVLTHIPSSDEVTRLRVRNLGKLERRKKRLREAASSRASSVSDATISFALPSKHKSIEEILADTDSEMDVDEEDEKEPKNKKKNKDKVWIAEEGDDIVDLQDISSTRKITGTKPGGSFGSILEKKQWKKKKDEFKTAPDGRLIIADLDTDSGDSDAGEKSSKKKKKKPSIPGLDDSEDDYEMSDNEDAFTSVSGPVGVKRTHSSGGSLYSGAPPSKYQAGGGGIHRPIGGRVLSTASSKKSSLKKKNKQAGGGGVKTGEEYRAKKARGDMKRKGLPDPYAYVPLRRDALNKRKKMKAMAQMRSILKGAQQGAKIGAKLKTKKKK